ncbi:MAG: hypothetical protein AAGA70_02250 [Pseudomonadota bacterium]
MKDQSFSVRSALSEATRAEHEALHVHPLLSRMVEPSLSMADYRGCLVAQLSFMSTIEAARLSVAGAEILSLRPECEALIADLCCADPVLARPDWARGPGHVLGALYVAHGSQFGRKVMACAVAKALPGASRKFLSLPSNPQAWRSLLADLQTYTGDLADLIDGAHAAFATMARAADHAAEALVA